MIAKKTLRKEKEKRDFSAILPLGLDCGHALTNKNFFS